MSSRYDWLTVSEVAELIGCETRRIRKLIGRGILVPSINGRIHVDDAGYLNRHPSVLWGRGSE
jgi:hypothetical protein